MSGESGVAKEIERKYLLSGLPTKVETAESYIIVHGWIPGNVIHERITWNSRGDGEFWRVIKTGRGLERIEAQEQIDAELFAKLLAACGKRSIRKRRYYIPEGSIVWELDEFEDGNAGLLLAEAEIPSADYNLQIPEWLQPYIIREVTDDPAYLNINLAKE